MKICSTIKKPQEIMNRLVGSKIWDLVPLEVNTFKNGIMNWKIVQVLYAARIGFNIWYMIYNRFKTDTVSSTLTCFPFVREFHIWQLLLFLSSLSLVKVFVCYSHQRNLWHLNLLMPNVSKWSVPLEQFSRFKIYD